MVDVVVTRGAREISLRFESFPDQVKGRLEQRITELTDELEAKVQGAAPFKTGALRSEIKDEIYADQNTRVAGYVSVQAPGVPGAYPKAATLEYGTNSPRRIPDHGGIFRRLTRGQKRIESRLTKPVHIDAFRYLRGPLEEMKPEIQEGLESALTEATAEANA